MAVMMILMVVWMVAMGPHGGHADRAPAPAVHQEAAMEGMDHSKMKINGQGNAAATDGHWMAPEDAVKRENPVAASAESRVRGKQLYAANCASCHGAAGRGDGPVGAALKPKPANLAAMAGQHPDGDFAWKIANGRGTMPAWKGTLTENQIWDLVNFVQGLGGPGKRSTPAPHHPMPMPGHAH